ncbi:MAG TPA: diiron oxygenase [Dehalococcoidia bacterium]|nr:diiron oxygenase [Dehalococcoidia bacterium]
MVTKTRMVTHNYTYKDALANSKKVAWTEDDVLNGRSFDLTKRFLPNSLSGVDGITSLNDDEKRKLNQIMGNAYCHIFAFVEEFIVPSVMEEAMDDPYGDEVRQRSLMRFSEEELKHQELFRRSIRMFTEQFGADPELIPGREEVAKVVRSKSKLAVVLLTAIIEWFTQVHYTEHVMDKAGLDALFRDLLKYHWLDEAQHAKLDTLLISELVEDLSIEEREAAIDEVIELGGAIDGLLQQQIGMNIDALEVTTGRDFTEAERAEITTETLRAWRWTFLVSGLEHPNVVKLVNEITVEGPAKFRAVAEALSA